VKTFVLFAVTAVAEILGCYLPYRWLREGASAWLLVPAALSLAAFAWLLTLHPSAAGRTYAAYGGVYIAVAILWLWSVDGIRPTNLGLAWRRTDIERYGRHRLSASIARAKPRQERRRHLVDACRAYGASATRSGAWTLVRTKAARQSTRVNLPPHRTSRLRLNGPTVTLAVRDFRSWK